MTSEDLLKKAVAAFKALSPDQQAEMMEEQRQSWVRGNVGLSRDERGMTSPVMPRPAPAATDTELETVAWQHQDYDEWHETRVPEYHKNRGKNVRELVTRSQAEELLAAERAEKEKWKVRGDQHWDTIRSIREMAREGDCERIILWVNDAGSGYTEPLEATVKSLTDKAVALEADNAAKDARIKELDRCHEGTIDLCNQKTAQIEALEAKLAAAEQAARVAHETLIEINPSNYNHDDVCQLNDASVEAIFLLADILGETHGKTKEWWDERRAALGGKP